MTLTYSGFVLIYIFITKVSLQCEIANGATFSDLLITNKIPARLYVPTTYRKEKLPVVVYYHGGAFDSGSTYVAPYDNFVQALVDRSKIIALSIDYRLCPAYDVSASYDDSWTALQYLASHSDGRGQNPTLNTLVDFRKIFLSGDSAGGNIAHNMAIKIASNKIDGLRINGIALLCPYFWGTKPIDSEPIDFASRYVANSIWEEAARTSNLDDTRINPLVDPKLRTLGTKQVLVITGNFDPLVFRGSAYTQMLRTNGYKGKVDLQSYNGGHDFFIFYLTPQNILLFLIESLPSSTMSNCFTISFLDFTLRAGCNLIC